MAAVAATRLPLLRVCEAPAEAPMRLIAAIAGGSMPVVKEDPGGKVRFDTHEVLPVNMGV